ncbi:MAG: hypothetical protein PHF79_02950, partial [Candidatus Pacebacteria bacterium]|nr:hypothetical protein [Candidatus Paceibacterota bacterium]
ADPLYAPENLKATHLLGFDRLALHARSISFMLADGVQKTVEAPFPKDFKQALADFEVVC